MGHKWLAKETHLCWLEVHKLRPWKLGPHSATVQADWEGVALLEGLWKGGLWKYVALPHFWLPSLLWVVMTSLSFVLLPPCLPDALISFCNGLWTLQNSELPGCLIFVSLKQKCACICSQFLWAIFLISDRIGRIQLTVGGDNTGWVVRGCIRKQLGKPWEQTSEQCYSMDSALVSSSRFLLEFLPWLLWMMGSNIEE